MLEQLNGLSVDAASSQVEASPIDSTADGKDEDREVDQKKVAIDQEVALTEELEIDNELMAICGRDDQFCTMNFCVSEGEEEASVPPSSSSSLCRVRVISRDEWEYPDSCRAGKGLYMQEKDVGMG